MGAENKLSFFIDYRSSNVAKCSSFQKKLLCYCMVPAGMRLYVVFVFCPWRKNLSFARISEQSDGLFAL